MNSPTPPPWIRSLCQRAPFASHLFILTLVLYGPLYAPWLYLSTQFAAHLMLLSMCMLSLIGAFCAWRGTKAHRALDWRAMVEAPVQVAEQEKDIEADLALRPTEIQHLIIVPNYKEDLSTLRETLEAFASHPRAQQAYHVCLGMEAREAGAGDKAKQLSEEYGHRFAQVVWSEHPADIPGEAAGKSSNVSWAARCLAAATSSEDRGRQIFTVIDADTHFQASYFDEVSVRFARLDAYHRQRSLFTPPILFNRNAGEVPVFVRQVDAMWSSAGMSSIWPGSNLKIPTSAYSVAAELAESVAYWDAGPDAIGEDMHMLCKTYLATAGTVHLESVYSPASCLDVVGNSHGQGWRGYVGDVQSRYGQALRHLWGSLDSGYVLSHLVWPSSIGWAESAMSTPSSGPDSPLPRISKRPSSLDMKITERSLYVDYDAPRSSSPLTFSVPPLLASRRTPARLPVLRTAHLLTRLYHAHFMLVHLVLFFIGKLCARIDPFTLATSPCLDAYSNWTAFLCNLIGAFSVVSTITSHLFYEAYCREAGHYRKLPWCLLDMVAIPFGLVYSLVPAVHAQTMHLFTNRLTYTVSLKPSALVKRATATLTTSSSNSSDWEDEKLSVRIPARQRSGLNLCLVTPSSVFNSSEGR